MDNKKRSLFLIVALLSATSQNLFSSEDKKNPFPSSKNEITIRDYVSGKGFKTSLGDFLSIEEIIDFVNTKAERINILKANLEKKSNELKNLNETHAYEISKLKNDHQAKVVQLTQQTKLDSAKAKKLTEESITLLQNAHEKNVSELTKAHEAKISNLQKEIELNAQKVQTISDECNKLKNELNALKETHLSELSQLKQLAEQNSSKAKTLADESKKAALTELQETNDKAVKKLEAEKRAANIQLTELQDQAKLIENSIQQVQTQKANLQREYDFFKKYTQKSDLIEQTKQQLTELGKQETVLKQLAQDFSDKIELAKYKTRKFNLSESFKTDDILNSIKSATNRIKTSILNLPRLTPDMNTQYIIEQAKIHATKKLDLAKRAKLVAQNQIKFYQALRHPIASPVVASILGLLGINSAAYKWYSSNKASASALEALAKQASLAKAAAEKAPFNRFVKRPLNYMIDGVKVPFNSNILKAPLNVAKVISKGIAKGTNGTISAAKKHPYYAGLIGTVSALALMYCAYNYYYSLNEIDDQNPKDKKN